MNSSYQSANARPRSDVASKGALGGKYIGWVVSGGREALTELLIQLTPIIQEGVARALFRLRWLSGGRNVRQELDDFIQETFLSLIADNGKALRAWNPALGLSLESYVRMVAERRVRTIIRTSKRNPWRDDPTQGVKLENASESDSDKPTVPVFSSVPYNAEGQLASKEILDRLRVGIEEQISPLGQTLFTRLFLDEDTVEEICDALHMSPDAVYAWKSRLTRHARRIVMRSAVDDFLRTEVGDGDWPRIDVIG